MDNSEKTRCFVENMSVIEFIRLTCPQCVMSCIFGVPCLGKFIESWCVGMSVSFLSRNESMSIVLTLPMSVTEDGY